VSALQGFLLGASLIIAIGAQNAFVLRQGILRRHVLPIVLFGAAADAVLIAVGVAGFGSLIASSPVLLVLLGSIAGRFPLQDRIGFASGAMAASVAWFFSLGFGARLLAPVFVRPTAWRVLDSLIAAVMFGLAGIIGRDAWRIAASGP